jgi:uncharacterized protein YbjT (DUF2867 family)
VDQHPLLVTGASGNVGRPVVAGLLAAGLPVRAAGRTAGRTAARGADGDDQLSDPAVQGVVFDFRDRTTWDAAFSGVRTMFLMRPPDLSDVERDLVPAVERGMALGLEHVVFLSLQGADRNRVVPHAKVEAWLRDSGLSWTFVRPSFFMQNLSTTHARDVIDGTLVVPAGRGRTAFVDALDVADVAVRALIDPVAHTGRAWTPTGPEALTYADVATRLSRALGRPVRYDRPGLLRYALHARRALAMPWTMVAVTAAIYTVARLGRAATLTDDVLTVTGHQPRSLQEFAIREAAVWRRPA